MIYLVQDCYKDKDGYHDILKIGYSRKSFGESRKSAYDTHNFGYTLISEREGSKELEGYLHRRLKDYNISLEWFRYDPEVIELFNTVSEDDISDFISHGELNEYIRDYILSNLIPSVSKLSDLYLEDLLEKLREESKEYPDLEYQEGILKKEILSVFEFVSSKEKEYFQTLNFEDENIKNLLSGCSLDLSKVSRRDDENFFKNIIDLFCRIKRKVTQDEFKSLQDQRRESTNRLLDLYKKGNLMEKQEYIQKLKNSIEYENYSNDFVSISKTTNQPVYNYLIEISNERAWEVSQKDYQDRISVTRSLVSEGFIINEYKTESDQIAIDFLDNHFYTTGIFKEKLKMYCEFCDIHRDNPEIMDIINHRITNPRFRQFYEYFGTSGCSSKNYQEGLLLRAWGNDSKEEKLKKEIYLTFKPGDRYSSKEFKASVQEIYDRLEITKTAKATDLGEYFKLTKTKITLPDKTLVNGLKLESL